MPLFAGFVSNLLFDSWSHKQIDVILVSSRLEESNILVSIGEVHGAVVVPKFSRAFRCWKRLLLVTVHVQKVYSEAAEPSSLHEIGFLCVGERDDRMIVSCLFAHSGAIGAFIPSWCRCQTRRGVCPKARPVGR